MSFFTPTWKNEVTEDAFNFLQDGFRQEIGEAVVEAEETDNPLSTLMDELHDILQNGGFDQPIGWVDLDELADYYLNAIW